MASVFRMDLTEKALRLPTPEPLPDEGTEFLWPVDLPFRAANLLEEGGRNLHANDRSITHGLPSVVPHDKFFALLGSRRIVLTSGSHPCLPCIWPKIAHLT